MWRRGAFVSCFVVLMVMSLVLFYVERTKSRTLMSHAQSVDLTTTRSVESFRMESIPASIVSNKKMIPEMEPSPEVHYNITVSNWTTSPIPSMPPPPQPEPAPESDEGTAVKEPEEKQETKTQDEEERLQEVAAPPSIAAPSKNDTEPSIPESPAEVVVVGDIQLEENSRKGEGSFLGAGLRGFTKKRGMVPPSYFTKTTVETRKSGFENWMRAYLNGNLVSHAPTPYPHCQVYINHHYKFIWIKGHKVGSTSMRGPLGWLCGDGWKVPKETDFSYCSHPVWSNDSIAVRDLKVWWKKYFVFGIIRNPYTRFASAEEYVKGMMAERCGLPTFEQTCREPYIHARLCRRNHCCWKGSAEHHYRHFMDQSSCLFSDMLLPAVDFIGEVENLDEDFQTIVDEINKRRDESLPSLVYDLKKKNSHGRKVETTQEGESYADRLFRRHPICLKAISLFYNRDFTLLEYEKLTELDNLQ